MRYIVVFDTNILISALLSTNSFQFSQEMAQADVEEVRSFSRLVEISTELKAVDADPDDDMVVECAVVGGATHIVTGDKHLLSLGTYQAIAIVKATEFVALLSQT